MVRGIEWRGGVNERFTGVEKADIASRGGIPSLSRQDEPLAHAKGSFCDREGW